MAKISEGMQGLMNDFLEAKRSFYGWDDETFKKKADNFRRNVKKVKFKPRRFNVIGRYNYRNGEVALYMDGNSWYGVNNSQVRGIVHELNHAFNHENGKRMNLVKMTGRKIPKNMKKYNYLSEIINEAETQVLFDREYSQALGREEPEHFYTYADMESVFKTLCICSNQDAVQFVREIEGKDLDGFVECFAKMSGHTLEDAKAYIDSVAELMVEFPKQAAEQAKNIKDISDFKNLNNITTYQEIYDMSKNYIASSSIDCISRQEMQEKLDSIQSDVKEQVISDFHLPKDIAKDIKLVDYPEVETGEKFEWGDAKSAIKMPQRYVGLDDKKRKEPKKQLKLSAPRVESVDTKELKQLLDNQKSSQIIYQRQTNQQKTPYQAPPAPTLFESMPDLAKINTPEETAKSYAEISAKRVETRTVAPQQVAREIR